MKTVKKYSGYKLRRKKEQFDHLIVICDMCPRTIIYGTKLCECSLEKSESTSSQIPQMAKSDGTRLSCVEVGKLMLCILVILIIKT